MHTVIGQYIYPATALIVILEIVLGRHKGIYTRDDWLVGISCLILNTGIRPVVGIMIAKIFAFLLPEYRGVFASTNLVLSFFCVFTVMEFCFYWVHRWAHENKRSAVPFLWKLHRTHHSGKFMNVGVTVRVNIFWSFVVPNSWILGLAIYLGMEKAAALSLLTVFGWNLITHSHFRWDDSIRRSRAFGKAFRAIEHILISPGMHHTHHGYGKDGGNFRNYAVTLSLFDWMFGTLHIPESRPWKYGLPGPNAHWAEEVFYPLYRRS